VPEIDPAILAIAAAAIFLGGFVKGTLGVGLPMTAVPIIANFLPVPTSVGIMFAPILASNLWQSLDRRHLLAALRRFAPLIAASLAGIALGARALAILDPKTLYALLGTVVLLFAALNIASPHLTVKPSQEIWMGPLAGLIAGLLGGFSALLGPPLIIYLMALKLEKDVFVTSISLIFLITMLALNGAMMAYGVIGTRDILISFILLVPTFLGMLIGRRLRNSINTKIFYRLVLAVLVISAVSLWRKAL
jgi:uncharacterized membrane protein YfcA